MDDSQKEFISKVIFTFIWDFKNGDNIIYNFDVLYELYKQRTKITPDWRKCRLNKPIIIIIVSIIECILGDFIDRIKEHSSEKIPNLDSKTIVGIKFKGTGNTKAIKKLKELTHFIDQIEKFNIFDAKTAIFYQTLHYFRKIRNRIHIQNYYGDGLNRSETMVFIDKNLHLAEVLLSIVIKKMFLKFPRPQNQDQLSTLSIEKFPFPWNT